MLISLCYNELADFLYGFRKLFKETLNESKQIEEIEHMIKFRLHESLEKATLYNINKLKDLLTTNSEARKILIEIPIFKQPKYKNLRNSTLTYKFDILD